MQFKDIIGQQEVINNLLTMYNNHRIPHAMMFVGREGVGALPLAIAFAQYINCTGDKSNDDSCGKCPSCVKYKNLVHPDFHMIFPNINKDKDSNSETFLSEWRNIILQNKYFTLAQWSNALDGEKQLNIRDNDASLLHQKLQLKAFEAKYQIMLIWYPEKMNDTFANKILKILEEPPSDTMFMLVAEKPSQLLPTILSRTQIINVPPIDSSAIETYIKNKYNIDSDFSHRVAHIANGNAIKAMQLVENADESKANLDFFIKIMRLCYSRKVAEMATMSDVAQKMSNDDLRNKLLYSLTMIRENFIMNLNRKELNYMSPDEENFSLKFSRFIHIDNVIEISEIFNTAIIQLEQNGSRRIIMMDLLLNLALQLRKARP